MVIRSSLLFLARLVLLFDDRKALGYDFLYTDADQQDFSGSYKPDSTNKIARNTYLPTSIRARVNGHLRLFYQLTQYDLSETVSII